MVIRLATSSWGPQFLVPTIAITKYSGCVVLREVFDEELFKKELQSQNICGCISGVNNAWYIRKKGTLSWLKVGETINRRQDFAVRLDTQEFSNGPYQVMGFMSVRVKTDHGELVVSRQHIADFEVGN